MLEREREQELMELVSMELDLVVSCKNNIIIFIIIIIISPVSWTVTKNSWVVDLAVLKNDQVDWCKCSCYWTGLDCTILGQGGRGTRDLIVDCRDCLYSSMA